MPTAWLSNYDPIEVTATTLTMSAAAHGGHVIVSNLAAAQTFTLPASSGSGNVYKVLVHTTKTGSLIVQVANATDVMKGTFTLHQDAADTAATFDAAATSDTVTLNGTTTGGLAGAWIELIDYKSGFWHVTGESAATGTEATPFSAAVS